MKFTMSFTFGKSVSKKKAEQGFGYIFARLTVDGKKRYYSTGIEIFRDEWKKYVSGDYNHDDIIPSMKVKYTFLDEVLSRLRNQVCKDYRLVREPYIYYKAKVEIHDCANGTLSFLFPKTRKHIYFSDFWCKYMEYRRENNLTGANRFEKVTKNQQAIMEKAFDHFIHFEKAQNHRYLLEEVSDEIIAKYQKWFSDNGIDNIHAYHFLKLTRSVFRKAYKMKLTTNMVFSPKRPLSREVDIKRTVLSPEMIKELEDLDLSTHQRVIDIILYSDIELERMKQLYCSVRGERHKLMEKARDLLLLGVYTGQTYANIQRISEEIVVETDGKKYLHMVCGRYKKQVMVPLTDKISSILKRNNGMAPKLRSDTFLYDIRFLGEILGWTWIPDQGDVKVWKKTGTRFCDNLSLNTARRTYAQIAYDSGASLQSIMDVVGYNTLRHFKRFLGLQE